MNGSPFDLDGNETATLRGACKDGERVKLCSRPGNDLTYRFPLIVEGLARLRSRSCIINGEAVACGDDGIALFERLGPHRAKR